MPSRPPRDPGALDLVDLEQVIADLVRWEGAVLWLYRDERGYVTIGIGHLVKSVDDCIALPLVGEHGFRAGTEEKTAAYLTARMCPAGLGSHAYENATHLRLPEGVARDLCERRLRGEFLRRLRWLCPAFDGWPLPARRALIDMAYNLGVGGLSRFQEMLKACDRVDWASAAEECHRRTCRDERNEWTRELFIEAASA